MEYQDSPREYRLGSINAVLNVYTRVSDLLSNPYDQVREQLRLLTAEPAFAFLADARPLFSTSPTIPGPVPAAGLPDNSASGAPVAEPKDLNAPQLPGTVTHAPDYRAPASFDPQKQPRPLDSFDAVPVVVPGDDQPELLGDLGLSSTSFDVETVRRDFPILQEQINGHPLIWLDNGATR